jgi:large subunit ribosomal protein L7Ae
LVLIANDVDRRTGHGCRLVPQDEGSFMIVKDKARLGALVHMKTAAVVCLTGVDKADQGQLSLCRILLWKFNNNPDLIQVGWRSWVSRPGQAHQRAKALAEEEAKKLASIGKA